MFSRILLMMFLQELTKDLGAYQKVIDKLIPI